MLSSPHFVYICLLDILCRLHVINYLEHLHILIDMIHFSLSIDSMHLLYLVFCYREWMPFRNWSLLNLNISLCFQVSRNFYSYSSMNPFLLSILLTTYAAFLLLSMLSVFPILLRIIFFIFLSLCYGF